MKSAYCSVMLATRENMSTGICLYDQPASTLLFKYVSTCKMSLCGVVSVCLYIVDEHTLLLLLLTKAAEIFLPPIKVIHRPSVDQAPHLTTDNEVVKSLKPKCVGLSTKIVF